MLGHGVNLHPDSTNPEQTPLSQILPKITQHKPHSIISPLNSLSWRRPMGPQGMRCLLLLRTVNQLVQAQVVPGGPWREDMGSTFSHKPLMASLPGMPQTLPGCRFLHPDSQLILPSPANLHTDDPPPGSLPKPPDWLRCAHLCPPTPLRSPQCPGLASTTGKAQGKLGSGLVFSLS